MKERDKAILDHLKLFRCMSRDDIADLHFSNLKNPINSTNNVLKRLTRDGHIKRSTHFQPYVYFHVDTNIKPDSAKIPHFLKIVQFYKQICKHSKPSLFLVEPKFGAKGSVEPDIMMRWMNNLWFVEIQRSVYSEKVMKAKMDRYEEYYNNETWKHEEWQPVDQKIFPVVWILSDTRYSIDRPFRTIQTQTIEELVSKASPNQVKKETPKPVNNNNQGVKINTPNVRLNFK